MARILVEACLYGSPLELLIQSFEFSTGLSEVFDVVLSFSCHAQQVRRELYGALTPMQRLSVARHPSRPTFLDHVMNMTDSVIQLTGIKLIVSSACRVFFLVFTCRAFRSM